MTIQISAGNTMGSNTCKGSFGTYTKDQYIAHIIEIRLLYTILQSTDNEFANCTASVRDLFL